jgi:hypothetical protein
MVATLQQIQASLQGAPHPLRPCSHDLVTLQSSLGTLQGISALKALKLVAG